MKSTVIIGLATLYLFVYIALITLGYAYLVIVTLYLISPLVVLWIVYSVFKDNSKEHPELGCNEELGYRDRPKETLGLF
ncbi:hypothetical protein [Mucilaginibacter endophyticus]|uniref:hypothetical protein n=1 Tax=Mucilaginibacter endophyticus TaxID=2675003 RepID=UPI000E0E05E2|nr:hypothetical protein [Mucilaginibacter endophyticus]